ncbi:hypothetical protein NEPTK9_001736 [Candidatus Neptunochlamydia vexilliferae]|uniref:Uncharacterized protein n=1 Tax=Candidatus Neptunichlamydia vexilliferae TaxID=1651774 RepID=A0ABS0B3M9_9BACT|nr:hypothetical protein [Candidatus Neptunochlamydia vexilliferae]
MPKFIARSSGIFSETCDFFASKIAPDYLHSAKKSQVSRKPPLNPLALNFSTEPRECRQILAAVLALSMEISSVALLQEPTLGRSPSGALGISHRKNSSIRDNLTTLSSKT